MVVNYIISISVMGLYPFYISSLWSVIHSNESFGRALLFGLRLSISKYLKLLAISAASFVSGILIVMLFHHIQINIFLEIVRIAIYSAIGVCLLYAGERICRSTYP